MDAASASDGVDEEAAQDAKAAEKAVSRLEVSAHRLLLRKERQILERGLRLFPSDVRLWERLFACLVSPACVHAPQVDKAQQLAGD